MHRAGAALGDHRAAPRQQLLLRDPALHAHVRRLAAELGRVDLAASGHDDRDAERANAGERAREQVAGLGVEDRAEREVDGLAVGGGRVAGAERERLRCRAQ